MRGPPTGRRPAGRLTCARVTHEWGLLIRPPHHVFLPPPFFPFPPSPLTARAAAVERLAVRPSPPPPGSSTCPNAHRAVSPFLCRCHCCRSSRAYLLDLLSLGSFAPVEYRATVPPLRTPAHRRTVSAGPLRRARLACVPKAPPFLVAGLTWFHPAVGRAGFPPCSTPLRARRRRAGRRADADAHRALSNPCRAALPRAHAHVHPPVRPLSKTRGRWPPQPHRR
jgi:hypothetical protein